MTEALATKKFIQKLKKLHPEWAIIKFNDMRTKGIPDMCICNGRHTLWIECKTATGYWQPYQRYMVDKLGGYFLVFDLETNDHWLRRPYGHPNYLVAHGPNNVLEYIEGLLP